MAIGFWRGKPGENQQKITIEPWQLVAVKHSFWENHQKIHPKTMGFCGEPTWEMGKLWEKPMGKTKKWRFRDGKSTKDHGFRMVFNMV